ncbi:hypothetical protein FA95DRAFT_982532 [Auriscalpium vulgare]|uniref:Uncharacterized protein n=1 Tax=Auriscalpium vulgare TaxID=40419 RepID=A0ACB8R6R2_9AGAM|nr:hypothetical protein FA95DRAFT_982532 [Auriscalpium vulgare]
MEIEPAVASLAQLELVPILCATSSYIMPIPFDIQAIIIEWVYRSSQHTAIDYPTLRACALVCRDWRPIAQRFLFRRVPHRSAHWVASCGPPSLLLLHTLCDNPHLAAHVRFIHLFLSFHGDASETANIALVDLCPHTEVVSCYNYTLMPGALEERLRNVQLRPVFLRVFSDLTFVECIMQTWPNIQGLDINVWRNSHSPEADPLIRAPCAVRSLSLRFTSWAPEDGLSSLRDLELNIHQWPAQLCHQLHASRVLPQIRSLRLMGHIPPPDILEHLVQLESLVLGTLPTTNVALPKSLRHLGYHPENASFAEQHDASFVLAVLQTLPSLQIVTLTCRLLAAHLNALEGACRDRGVDLEVYKSFHHYRLPRNVDWI